MTGPDPDEIPDAAAGFTPHPGLEFDASGAPFDPVYRDVFRNRAGAWSESEAVFVDGCRARERWRRAERFCVLELGFGLGSEPTGAFYVLAHARHLAAKFGGSSLKLAFDILEKVHVGVTPGIDFGPGGEGYLRFSYANSLENIEEGMARLAGYLERA